MRNKGPKIEPCGTPVVKLVKVEKVQLQSTSCFLFTK